RMNEDDQIRENLLAIENAKRVHATLMQNAEEEGFSKGIEQGSKQEKIDIAKNMLQDNMPIEIIIKYTGLTIKEIESLK
ncbi:MAG: hypothetical protein HFH46_01625, partial [Bacilli bacterium]|nr:hypothetical protein [Bacilli bacterium]